MRGVGQSSTPYNRETPKSPMLLAPLWYNVSKKGVLGMFGYGFKSSDKGVIYEFTDLRKPYFHRGNEVGCLVLHGFTGTPANMRSVYAPLEKAGYTVHAPLLSGHGTTLADMNEYRASDWLSDALAGYQKLREEGCTRIYVCGLSMGAILSGLVAERRDCAGVVLMSAPVRMQGYLNFAYSISPLFPYIILPHKELKDEERQGYQGIPARRLGDIRRLSAMLRKDMDKVTCPVFIIQPRKDNRDKLNSVDILVRGLVHARSVKIQYFDNSPHGITYGPERAENAHEVLNFVQSTEADRIA